MHLAHRECYVVQKELGWTQVTITTRIWERSKKFLCFPKPHISKLPSEKLLFIWDPFKQMKIEYIQNTYPIEKIVQKSRLSWDKFIYFKKIYLNK